MKYVIKLMVSIISVVLFLTSSSVAKKQFVPIVNDDILTMASYNTSIDNLKVPDLEAENLYYKLLVQCEEDITYFLLAYNVRLGGDFSVSSSLGNVIIDKKIFDQNVVSAYMRGHIDGEEAMTVTAKLTDYFDHSKIDWLESEKCRTKNTPVNTLKVPTFNGNSQGKLVIQCEDDVVYYIMAYDCLRSWTNPTATADNGVAVVDEKKHVGEVFYVKGHVERKNTNPVTITGKLLNEFDKRTWTQTCP